MGDAKQSGRSIPAQFICERNIPHLHTQRIFHTVVLEEPPRNDGRRVRQIMLHLREQQGVMGDQAQGPRVAQLGGQIEDPKAAGIEIVGPAGIELS